jgi:hypothetical protein
VLSSGQNAVRRNLDCLPLIPVRFLLLLFLGIAKVGAQAQPAGQAMTLDQAVQQLAEKVAAIPSVRGPLRLQYFEDTAFAEETGKDWQEIFREELQKSTLSLTADAGANLLRVGLAETPTEIVLSAGVRMNEKEEVRFVTLPRTVLLSASLPVVPVRIEKQLLFQSPDRLLDAVPFVDGNESGWLVLGYRETELSVIKMESSGTNQQAVSLAAAGVPASRDLRGELVPHSSDVTVVLQGKTCQVSWSTAGQAKCHSGTAVWRAAVVLTRSCDKQGWKLMAHGADWSVPGLLQVVPNAALGKGSAALLSDFPGPILNIAPDPDSAALVVTRNLRTGNYEVYKITLLCGN